MSVAPQIIGTTDTNGAYYSQEADSLPPAPFTWAVGFPAGYLSKETAHIPEPSINI